MRFSGLLVWILLGSTVGLPADAVTVEGTLIYEKIPATVNGLDLGHPVETPAPQVRIELRTSDLQQVVARGATDENGAYRLEVPNLLEPLVLYVLSQCEEIYVAQPENNLLYAVAWPEDRPVSWPKRHVIPKEERLSGPFNILATLCRAHRLLRQIEPGLPLTDQPLIVYWSPNRDQGSGQTSNTIYLNGRRDVDSDEFDDSVILELYGVYLLERFAPYNGPAGPWALGERLDPRLAWHGGWRYFFAQAVLGTPVYIDTMGPEAKQALTIDLEQDVREGDSPGYWSVHSVASALWDLYAERGSDRDHVGLRLGPLWRVLREYFPQQVFPYLITMADGLIQQDPSRESGVTAVLAKRQIEYQFGKVPPVPAPFPRLLTSGVPVTGRVDSLQSKRINLLESADHYLIRLDSAKRLSLRLMLTGEPGPGAGRLYLELLNDQGAVVKDGKSWLWGSGDEAELTASLPAGTYVLSVLGYWPGIAFGSAQYRLTVDY